MQKLTCVEVKKLRWRKRMNRYRCGCGDDGSRLSSILAVCGVKNKKCIRCLGWEGETWSGFWVRVGVHGILSYTYAASWSAKGVIEPRCGCLCLYFVNLDMVFERIQWFFLFFLLSLHQSHFFGFFLPCNHMIQGKNLLDCVIRGSVHWIDSNSSRWNHSYTNRRTRVRGKHNDYSLLKNNHHWSNIYILAK